jgi:hypothetical protein
MVIEPTDASCKYCAAHWWRGTPLPPSKKLDLKLCLRCRSFDLYVPGASLYPCILAHNINLNNHAMI